MNGSECPSWYFEFGSIASPFIWGLDKIVDFGVILGYFLMKTSKIQ